MRRHIARAGWTLLLAVPCAVLAAHRFRPSELRNPAPRFQAGLLLGPQMGEVSDRSAKIRLKTLWSTQPRILLASDDAPTQLIDAPVAGEEHVFSLTDLLPDVEYSYRVDLPEFPPGPEHRFRTAPPPGEGTVRVLALGDTGGGTVRLDRLLGRAQRLQPHAIFHLGDLAYPDGHPVEFYHRFLVPFAALSATAPVYAALGNHDAKTGSVRPFLEAVFQPVNPVSNDETFYAFQRGPLSVVCINTETSLEPGSEQRQWLETTLPSLTGPWRAVMGHHSVYPGSRSGGSDALRRDLVPLLETHDVDLYLCGHDHVYMRSYPLRDGVPVATDQEPRYQDPPGPIHVVSGGGGKSLYPVHSEPHLVVARSVDHFVVLECSPTRLLVRALTAEGEVIDSFEIYRSE